MNEKNIWLPTNKNIEDYELLKDMLLSQKKELDLLSKKKADEQLNPMKIKIINRVLEPLKEIFSNEPYYQFLDILNNDDMPTNSDVVLIISQYKTGIIEFADIYYRRAEPDYHDNKRWMTEEYPPGYYEEDEEDYEDE